MADKSVVFWFSGTGNSLYAAKRISEAVGGVPLVRITDASPDEPAGGTGAKVGFVFPSYYGNLPRAVRAFAEKVRIEPGSYVFTVVTMGGMGQGSVWALDSLLKKRGITLNYGRCVLMNGNYIVNYDPAGAVSKVSNPVKIDSKIDACAADIAAGKHSVKKIPFIASNLYKNIEALDAGFITGEKCTGCGQCEKLCPVRNIRVENGRPRWLHHCEHCVSCINLCPVKAIDYGEQTKTRGRYINPHIKIEELINP